MLKFFPDFGRYLLEIKEFRAAWKVRYPMPFLVVMSIVSRLMGHTSNHATDALRDNSFLLHALNRLSGCSMEELPHSDTVRYALERLEPEELAKLRDKMADALLRKRVLEDMRVLGYYLVAIDGVHHHTSHHEIPHSTHCTHADGTTDYRLTALEAKLVSPSGAVLSMETEQIENPQTEYDKQDCEKKACLRLLRRLHEKYPRLNICVLMDGLYFSRIIIDMCESFGWKYSITLKEGEAKIFYARAEERLGECRHNRLEDSDPVSGLTRTVSWCNGVSYDLGSRGKAVEPSVVRMKTKGSNPRTLMYVTNIHLAEKNATTVLDRICRTRWKIENQGFNFQMNGGLGLERVFGTRKNAAFNYYLIVQIAHILLALMVNSSLFRRLQQMQNPEKVPRTICEPMLKWFRHLKNIIQSIARDILTRELSEIDYASLRLAMPGLSSG